MKRGEIYRVFKAAAQDPKDYRLFVVVSRQSVIDSSFSTVTCAPVYTRHDSLSTQVQVGINQGLKHESSIHCDELVSIPKRALTHYIGALTADQLDDLAEALRVALAI